MAFARSMANDFSDASWLTDDTEDIESIVSEPFESHKQNFTLIEESSERHTKASQRLEDQLYMKEVNGHMIFGDTHRNTAEQSEHQQEKMRSYISLQEFLLPKNQATHDQLRKSQPRKPLYRHVQTHNEMLNEQFVRLESLLCRSTSPPKLDGIDQKTEDGYPNIPTRRGYQLRSKKVPLSKEELLTQIKKLLVAHDLWDMATSMTTPHESPLVSDTEMSEASDESSRSGDERSRKRSQSARHKKVSFLSSSPSALERHQLSVGEPSSTLEHAAKRDLVHTYLSGLTSVKQKKRKTKFHIQEAQSHESDLVHTMSEVKTDETGDSSSERQNASSPTYMCNTNIPQIKKWLTEKNKLLKKRMKQEKELKKKEKQELEAKRLKDEERKQQAKQAMKNWLTIKKKEARVMHKRARAQLVTLNKLIDASCSSQPHSNEQGKGVHEANQQNEQMIKDGGPSSKLNTAGLQDESPAKPPEKENPQHIQVHKEDTHSLQKKRIKNKLGAAAEKHELPRAGAVAANSKPVLDKPYKHPMTTNGETEKIRSAEFLEKSNDFKVSPKSMGKSAYRGGNVKNGTATTELHSAVNTPTGSNSVAAAVPTIALDSISTAAIIRNSPDLQNKLRNLEMLRGLKYRQSYDDWLKLKRQERKVGMKIAREQRVKLESEIDEETKKIVKEAAKRQIGQMRFKDKASAKEQVGSRPERPRPQSAQESYSCTEEKAQDHSGNSDKTANVDLNSGQCEDSKRQETALGTANTPKQPSAVYRPHPPPEQDRAHVTARSRRSQSCNAPRSGSPQQRSNEDRVNHNTANPFQKPKLCRPKSRLENSGIKGPGFSRFIWELVNDQVEKGSRPEPQGSDTPGHPQETLGKPANVTAHNTETKPTVNMYRSDSERKPAAQPHASGEDTARLAEPILDNSSKIFAMTSIE